MQTSLPAPANPAIDDDLWRAVLARDAGSDGSFFYGVRSTGIYCRPSCPSRRPRREHVIFFPALDSAERAGFRPCRRCHPRLFEELGIKRQTDADLKVAVEIQARLLPTAGPAIDGWEIAACIRSCKEIGGDYYDVVARPGNDRMMLAVGDAAGKGIAAALTVCSLHAAVRAWSRMRDSIGDVVAELNRYFHDNTPANRFLTLFCADLDRSSGRVTYTSAGHNAPMLVSRSGTVTRLDIGGLPLGITPDAEFDEGALVMAPGDVLVAFTDGITEARDEAGEEFGEKRLIDLVGEAVTWPAERVRQHILTGLRRFTGAVPPTDDQTLVVVRRA